jgi:hypothetical protein
MAESGLALTDEEAEQLIDGVVDPTPALSAIEPTDLMVQQLTDDVARAIMTYPEIAKRYGMDIYQLHDFIARPEIRKLTKAKRAIWQSENAASDRLKAYWAMGMIEAAPSTLKLLQDPTVSPAVKVELSKLGAKIVGVDGGGRENSASGMPANGQFAVNIIFSQGREEITTVVKGPVIEGEREPHL